MSAGEDYGGRHPGGTTPSAHTPQSPPAAGLHFQPQGSGSLHHGTPQHSFGRAGSHLGQQADLASSLEALMQSGPHGAVTVNTQPLYDAVMTLFGFVKQQAGKQQNDTNALQEEMASLRGTVDSQRRRIEELEERSREGDGQGLRLVRRDLDNLASEFRHHQKYVEEELTTTGQELRDMARKVAKIQGETAALSDEMQDKANTSELSTAINRTIPQLVKSECEKGLADAVGDIDALREQTASQLKELAMHVNSIAGREQKAGVTPEQLSEHLSVAEARMEKRMLEDVAAPLQRELSNLGAQQADLSAATRQEQAKLDEKIYNVNDRVEDEVRRITSQVATVSGRVTALEDARGRTQSPDTSDLRGELARQARDLQDLRDAHSKNMLMGAKSSDGPSADVIQEAFQMIRGRLEELEENREEQGKAAVVISQYFDKLDHLYSLLDLDKRAAAYGASLTDQEEKIGLLMALPVFERLNNAIRQAAADCAEAKRGATGLANLFSVPTGMLSNAANNPPASPPLQALYSLPIFADLRCLIEDAGNSARASVSAVKQTLTDLSASVEARGASDAGSGRAIGDDRRNVSPVRRMPDIGGGGGGGGGGVLSIPEAGVELADAQGGATVTGITGGFPCYNAGWRVGDHVVAADNLPVHSAADFASAVRRNANGSVSVSRIPAGSYRPVSGILILRSTGGNNTPARVSHWH